ncbi:winged helix family two component transcriptional regulator [Litorimonas taeanensis]|uniref:Winged helix family two component transcriptional regulator n=1 Tax=Litorimonas taeanensis TaxID=568099 RepID=A0A420WKP4_9PROT|nr:response regulator transcription factor [Litorimonas taeanensis]RKQ71574.1 winged helix family two component transcriptional regulator [Litorimonas taeanensis]
MTFTPMTELERQNTHILIVDDDNRIRLLLQKYLNREGFRTSVAEDAAKARLKMQGLAFDLLILDVMMPGEDGLSLAKSLRQGSDVPIILLTAKGQPSDRISGLRAGADDYLSKPFEPEELLLRIDNIFRRGGQAPVSQNVVFGDYSYDVSSRLLLKNGERIRLTTGEDVLLNILAKQGGGTVSRFQLSQNINATSDRAVDVQITRLRRKIEDNPAEPNFILTVRGQGYRLICQAGG